jgi:hypothetical protein
VGFKKEKYMKIRTLLISQVYLEKDKPHDIALSGTNLVLVVKNDSTAICRVLMPPGANYCTLVAEETGLWSYFLIESEDETHNMLSVSEGEAG